ncbi:MAG: anthranilate synthase component I [Bacillota bacterium]
MARPSREEFVRLARGADGEAGEVVIPVWEEVVADVETPVSALLKLARHRPVFLLESAEGGEHVGRYSFLGLDPFWEVRGEGDTVTIRHRGGEECLSGDPVAVLRSRMARYRLRVVGILPRFCGGAVGYVSYEWVHRLEKLPRPRGGSAGWPEAVFVMAEVVVVFDHLRHTLGIVVNALPGDDAESCYRRARARIEEIKGDLARPLEGGVLASPVTAGGPGTSFRSNLSREEFCQAVRRAKEYIRAGDIFQVVLSQRLEAPLHSSPLSVYRVLRAVNPSPYMFFLDLGDMQLAGASPEMLVRVEDGWVETRPIAGTRLRGRDAVEDEVLARELLSDAKERAEHVMLVDLGRNDVGRVSQPGTVRVTEFMRVERYSHVMHIVSAVRGRLCPDADAFSALASCFPAGTLTGAPKVRAMEIISDLEPVERGPYGGAVGYFAFSGNADMCITIRTVQMRRGRVVVQAGAGIVADSDPDREYEETLAKARALLLAVEAAGGSGVPARAFGDGARPPGEGRHVSGTLKRGGR